MKTLWSSKRDRIRETRAYLKDIKNGCKVKERQSVQDECETTDSSKETKSLQSLSKKTR